MPITEFSEKSQWSSGHKSPDKTNSLLYTVLENDVVSRLSTKLDALEVGNSKVVFFPERGGHIMSCTIDGVELFYQELYESRELLQEGHKPKGGMPYMFPIAGPSPQEGEFSDLPQHGFGRLTEYKTLSNNNGISKRQGMYFKNKSGYPYSGGVVNTISIKGGCVTFEHRILNKSDKEMPISTGLHPYFRIPHGVKKSDIKFLFKGGKEIQNNIASWPRAFMIDHPGGELKIYIPKIGTITMETSGDYKKLWIRTIPGRNFVCIEPVMGNPGNIEKSPIVIPVLGVHNSYMKLSLEKDR